MPPGLDVTVPVPPPARTTVRRCVVVVNVAVTLVGAVIVSTQVPVPVHAPLQPANDEPTAGVAVKVTTVPVA